MDPAELQAEVAKGDGPILRMKANASPILAELWELEENLLSGFTEADLDATASAVRGDEAFVARLHAAAVASETIWPKSTFVELQIYDNFIQDWDEDVCRRFHAAPRAERLALVDRFRDSRLKKLARRLIYFERPDLLEPHLRIRMDAAVSGRLRGNDPGAPGRTLAATLQEFDALMAEVGPIDANLAHYRAFLQSQLAVA
jgi:exodeoxyribonuclease-1